MAKASSSKEAANHREVSDEKFQLVATIEKVNRLALATGQNGKLRASKCVVQVKLEGENNWQIWISSTKDINGQRYDVSSIQKVRVNFVHEGKLTIQLRDPPFDLLFRDCKANDLKCLVQKLQSIKTGTNNGTSSTSNKTTNAPASTRPSLPCSSSSSSLPSDKRASDVHKRISKEGRSKSENFSSPSQPVKLAPIFARTPGVVRERNSSTATVTIDTNSASSSSGGSRNGTGTIRQSQTTRNNMVEKNENLFVNVKKIDDNDNNEGKGKKRVYSDMSKTEATNIKRALRKCYHLVVTQRSDYPQKPLDKDLERIVFQGISLRRIDTRICNLVQLKVLSLEHNKITSIDALINLNCSLESLNLSNNEIQSIDEAMFRSPGMSKLCQLYLNRNQLKSLPSSICDLQYLRDLQVSNNKLTGLPYNIHRLRNLKTLKASDNNMQRLPLPISYLRLSHLDVSSNALVPITNREVNIEYKHVKMEAEPTLFEIAGGVLLSQFYNNKMKSLEKSQPVGQQTSSAPPNIVPDVFDTRIVPEIIVNYFRTHKYCFRCGQYHLRYSLIPGSTLSHFAEEAIISGCPSRELPTFEAVCDKCIRRSSL